MFARPPQSTRTDSRFPSPTPFRPTRPEAIAVPQQAVQGDTAGRGQLYIVGADGTVELRTVKAGDVAGDRWVIEEGLRPGELVVVEGFQKIRPGAKVDAQPWQGGEQATTAVAQ